MKTVEKHFLMVAITTIGLRVENLKHIALALLTFVCILLWQHVIFVIFCHIFCHDAANSL